MYKEFGPRLEPGARCSFFLSFFFPFVIVSLCCCLGMYVGRGEEEAGKFEEHLFDFPPREQNNTPGKDRKAIAGENKRKVSDCRMKIRLLRQRRRRNKEARGRREAEGRRCRENPITPPLAFCFSGLLLSIGANGFFVHWKGWKGEAAVQKKRLSRLSSPSLPVFSPFFLLLLI